jgi:copper chaperone CopZ
MSTHTVTVQFDDEKMSVDNVVEALNGAGYSVPAYQKSGG